MMRALSSGPQLGVHASAIPASAASAAAVACVVAGEHRDPVAGARAAGRRPRRPRGAARRGPRSPRSPSRRPRPAPRWRRPAASARRRPARAPASIQPGRPSRTGRPSTVPVSPAPVTASTSAAGPGSVDGGQDGPGQRVLAARLQRGGHRQHLLAGRRRRRWRRRRRPGRLRVRVPVLSSATVRIGPSASRAAPPLTSTPEPAGGADRGDHGDRHRDGQRARGGGDQHDQGPLDPQQRIPEQRCRCRRSARRRPSRPAPAAWRSGRRGAGWRPCGPARPPRSPRSGPASCPRRSR